MAWIPGWDTVGGTGWWSGFYFWCSIGALIGLGVAEVASHRYSERKDELFAVEQDATQKRHDEDMARVEHDTAQASERAAQLEKEAAEVKLELERTKAELAGYRRPRKLSQEQKDRIALAIKPFPPVTFVAMTNPEAEPWDFVLNISATLEESGWNWQPFPGSGLQAIDGRPREGMTIADHIEVQTPPDLEAAGKALADAIRDPGIIGMDDVRLVVDVRITTMTIIVGSKK